jgi:heat shock protein HtpX
VSDRNLFAQQEANRRKSRWLVIGFIVFFTWAGFGGDLAFYLSTRELPPERYHHVIPFIGIAALIFAAGTTRYAWLNGAKRVLDASMAQELVNPATPELKRLDNVVEEMAIAAGIPKPKIWIVPDPDPNAFATGPEPGKASIAVTEGLLRTLDRDELQAVIAHEMSHIRNYDTRLMTLLAAMVGAILLMSNLLKRYLWSGGRVGGKNKSKNPLAAVVLVAWILTLILAPIVTAILQMAVSRKREFLADATGAQLNRNPLALASALEKIDGAAAPTTNVMKGSAHMCIVDPAGSQFTAKEGFLGNVFASHPPIRLRVARLRGMAYASEKREARSEKEGTAN